jgi:hypothetical protein
MMIKVFEIIFCMYLKTISPDDNATPSAMKKWPYKRGGLIRGVAL